MNTRKSIKPLIIKPSIDFGDGNIVVFPKSKIINNMSFLDKLNSCKDLYLYWNSVM